MITLYAMRRANGDWFAMDDKGSIRVPVFHSSAAAMMARSRDTGMECFRPVQLEPVAFKNLCTTEEGKASFWLISNPSLRLSRGQEFSIQQLERFMADESQVGNRLESRAA